MEDSCQESSILGLKRIFYIYFRFITNFQIGISNVVHLVNLISSPHRKHDFIACSHPKSLFESLSGVVHPYLHSATA
ncbi:hypothetical protein SAMN05216232_1912 [Virgibacillus subterraneus]|uniref:Uncharacterized protein n=1 Tax=Virgibacillus subterraneus TaxID=621109 RepID=A0A1H9E6Q4_9BACI|nr:hypothetical protein SAMN05216232_1912 [Virgibacillus subterraneus]